MQVKQVTRDHPVISRGKDPETNKMSDEVRMGFRATTADGQAHEFKAYCSYKKHLVGSYRTNDGYQPRISQTGANTITRLDEFEFLTAFNAFGRKLEEALLAEGDDLDASDPKHVYGTGMGIWFRSDTDWILNKFRDLHCFPCIPSGQSSPVTYDLPGQQFSDFITVLRYLWSGGESVTVERKVVENKQDGKVTVVIPKTNMTTELGAQKEAARSFRRMLGIEGAEGEAVWGQLRSEQLATRRSAWEHLQSQAWFFGLTSPLEREALVRKFGDEYRDTVQSRHKTIRETIRSGP